MFSNAARAFSLAAALASAAPTVAQELCPCPPPKPPEPAWKGSLGAGLALTSGNTSTRTYNLSFAASYDPKSKNLVKLEGLYLRGENGGVVNVDKTAAAVRDEYRVNARAFVFGELRYQRDPFKDISYVIAPLGGFGYRVLDSEKTKLGVDAALGGQFEELRAQQSSVSGAAQTSQSFSYKFSDSVSFAEHASALFKLGDFGDALYRFEASVVSSISRRVELKVAWVKDYKNRPAQPGLQKGDDSLVAVIVFKIG